VVWGLVALAAVALLAGRAGAVPVGSEKLVGLQTPASHTRAKKMLGESLAQQREQLEEDEERRGQPGDSSEEEDREDYDAFPDSPFRKKGEGDREDPERASGMWVAFCTSLMALASGLGAAPFFLVEKVDRKWLGIANALASGVMMAASFGLIKEGLEQAEKDPSSSSLVRLVLGMGMGLAFIVASQRLLEGHEVTMGSLHGMDAKRAMMVMGIMTLHSFSEGLGVGVSYGGEQGHRLGMVTTAAIAVHNIPEGLAVALVAVPRGESKWRAAGWAVLSSLGQPIVAVPSYVFVEWFSWLLPIGLGSAAGTMIWMVIAELIPDAIKASDAHTVGTVFTISLIVMTTIQALIERQMQ